MMMKPMLLGRALLLVCCLQGGCTADQKGRPTQDPPALDSGGMAVRGGAGADSPVDSPSHLDNADRAPLDLATADTLFLERPTLTVGQSGGAAPYLFSNVSGAILLEDRGIAMADGRSLEIRFFDLDGRHTVTVGGRGEGPGEFRMLKSLHRGLGDTLIAFDPILQRLTLLSDEGALLGTHRLTGGTVSPDVYVGYSVAGGFILSGISNSMPGAAVGMRRDSMWIERYDRNGERQERLTTLQGMKRFEFGPGDAATYPFTPELHASVLGNALYFGNGETPTVYALRLDSTSAVLDSIYWVRAPERAEPYWASLDATGPRAPDLDRLPKNEPIPFLAGIVALGEEEMLIRPYQPALDARWGARRRAGGVWWRVRPSTGLLGVVRLPDGVELLDYRAGRYLGLQRDALGVESLVLFVASGS